MKQEKKPSPSISIVIVNWNAGELLQKCVYAAKSAESNLDSEVFIVDNASSDGSLSEIERSWPDVKIIVNSANYGFAVACNQGIRATRGKYVMILNPDAIVGKHAIWKLSQFLDMYTEVGAVSPMLFGTDGNPEIGFCGYVPTIRHLINHYFFISKIFPGRRWSKGFYLRGEPQEPLRLDWVSGACILFRRSALEEVRLFDERFFLYLEDMDLCLRLRKKSYEIYLLPDACVLHVGQHCVHQASADFLKNNVSKLPNYIAQSRGTIPGHAATAIIWTGLFLRLLIRFSAMIITRSDKARRVFMRAYRIFRLGAP